MKEKVKENEVFTKRLKRPICSIITKRSRKLHSMDRTTLNSVHTQTILYELTPGSRANKNAPWPFDDFAIMPISFEGPPVSPDDPAIPDDVKVVEPSPVMVNNEMHNDAPFDFVGMGLMCPGCGRKYMLPDEHILNYRYFIHTCDCGAFFHYTDKLEQHLKESLDRAKKCYGFSRKKYLKAQREIEEAIASGYGSGYGNAEQEQQEEEAK